MPPPRPEYAVLQLAAASSFGEARERELAALVGQGMDWEYLFQEVQHHALTPRLYTRLTRSVEAPPDDEGYARLMRSLQRRVSPYAVLSLFLSAEMRAIAEVMDAAALPYLVLKGPSLAEAYGGVGYRPFVDNDLLIRRADFQRTDEALRAAGFERRTRTPMRLTGYLYIHGELTYSRIVTGQVSTLDLHTALVPPGLSYREPFDVLRDRARLVPVGGTTVPTLAWEDALLALVVNGLKDQWRTLRLVSDVAAVAAMVTDWDAVRARAHAARSLRGLHIALRLAESEALSPPPEALRAEVAADAHAVALADWIAARLRMPFDARPQGWRDRAHLNLGAQDDWLGGLRYTSFVALRRMTERYVDPHPDA